MPEEGIISPGTGVTDVNCHVGTRDGTLVLCGSSQGS